MFEALRAANVDWNVVAGAIATFIVTAVVTAFGFRRGFRRVNQSAIATPTSIAGASLMDNMSILMLTEALRDSTQSNRDIQACLIKIETLLQLQLNKRH